MDLSSEFCETIKMPVAKSWAIDEVYGKQRKQFMNDIDLLLWLHAIFLFSHCNCLCHMYSNSFV